MTHKLCEVPFLILRISARGLGQERNGACSLRLLGQQSPHKKYTSNRKNVRNHRKIFHRSLLHRTDNTSHGTPVIYSACSLLSYPFAPIYCFSVLMEVNVAVSNTINLLIIIGFTPHHQSYPLQTEVFRGIVAKDGKSKGRTRRR